MASALARVSLSMLSLAAGQHLMDSVVPRFTWAGDFPAPQFFTQAQDHFDPSNDRSWHQAYYVNDTFWTPGSDAPIFLCVGGEGPALDGSAVVSSVHCNVAVEWLQSQDALMFAIEHRYYGCHNMSACPVTDLSATGALKYLSSRQAIEDVAAFVKGMNAKYGLSSKNKWVTWGGSYPGMLAGWSRIKHPELIHAAVASSAPVHAKLDMSEYYDHVAIAYTVADNSVGGSTQCRDAIRAAHVWIEQQFSNGSTGIAAVESRFNLGSGSLSTLEARINFGAAGAANFPSQENDPLCQQPGCNIAKICQIMTNESRGNEVQRLVELRNIQASAGTLGTKRSLPRVSDDWPDFWFYQTCNEFGFYQTCEIDSTCMFLRGLDSVDFYVKDCRKYDLNKSDVARNIENTNKHYGALKPIGPSGSLGSCVLWPNGEVDPWSTLSVLKSPAPEQPVIYVPGASHHAWTWPSQPGDQASVIRARELIRDQVTDFLSQPCIEEVVLPAEVIV